MLNFELTAKERMAEFYKPIPKEAGSILFKIIRNKSGFNMFFPKYTLILESTGEFIMNAKKRTGNMNSNYLVSYKEDEFDKKKESFIGKLRLK